MRFKMKNVLKLRFFPIKLQNLKKISHLVLKFTLELQNQVRVLFQILWPSQNILTLQELLEACRHRRKHLLVSLFKPPSKKEPPDTTIK